MKVTSFSETWWDPMSKESNMARRKDHEIQRNEAVVAKEIEELRVAVGWGRLENKYDRILANSYAHFTLRENGHLVAFVNVLSDGIVDAFLLDLMVHPSMQRRGVGKALVDAAIAGLTNDGIRCIHVTFDAELERFYRGCGFHIFKGGIIDNDPMDEN